LELAPIRLIKTIDAAIAARSLASPPTLHTLAVITYQCVAGATGAQRAVAYALYHFLGAAEYNFDERPVGGNEADNFMATTAQPLMDAAQFIGHGEGAAEALQAIVKLSNILESAEFSATFWRPVTCAHSRRATVR
jgi:hypothetical protein